MSEDRDQERASGLHDQERASGATGFLGRWSRRKRAALAPATVEAPPAAVASPAEALPEFDPASLPPVESLTAESDIAAFLRPQVPAALRTAALRRAWTLDPAIRDYIGPADYAWDFNAPDGMAGFSLELGGDVKRLLAQAIGLVEEEKPPAAETADGSVPASAEPVGLAPAEPVDLAQAEPLALPPAASVRLGEAAPEALIRQDEPTSPPAAAAPARRHGSARPA
ncbi:DUF3306 domain-containing protein [Dankookia sp. GCM10030260]|uniref:DUF3306 domain-containing protein n=1 Tax=Dankookia sp. GCM10030260 TaxID=3273390 RepID=UPI003613C06F